MSEAGEKVMIVSLGQLASVPGLPSEPMLRKLIEEEPDFPVIKRGTNGQAYELDLAASIRFIQNRSAAEEERKRLRADEVRQYGLDLLGKDAAIDPDRIGMSASERRALMEEEVAAIKLGQLRREYVRKSSVEAAIGAVMTMLNTSHRSLAARLSKRMDLSRDQIAIINEMVERDLNALADKFVEIGRSEDAASELAVNSTV